MALPVSLFGNGNRGEVVRESREGASQGVAARWRAVAGPLVGSLLIGLLGAAGCGGADTSAPHSPVISGAGSQPTATTPRTASPQPTAPPQTTASPQATASPKVPARSIETGGWEFLFRVLSNSCGGDPVVGTVFDFEYHFDETREPRRGYISDGDPVRVSHIGGTYVANLIFSWPTLSFDYPIDGGHAYVTTTFVTASTGVGSLTESYDSGAGDTCSIFLRDDG